MTMSGKNKDLIKDIEKIATKRRFGYFSIPPTLAHGDIYYKPPVGI